MKKINRSLTKGIANGFIAFMCTLLLVCLTLILILEKTLFSPTFLTNAAGEANYYKDLSVQITRQIQDFGQGSGIPEQVLVDIIPQKLVKQDFDAYSKQAFYGNNFNIEKDEFIKRIEQPIDAYAKEKNQELTGKTKEGITKFSEKSYKAYGDYIKLPFLPAFGQKIQIFSNKLSLIKVIVISSFVLLLIFLIYLQHWWIHRLFRYLSHIFCGGGLMMLVIPGVIRLSGVINKISIGSKPLYNLLTTYLNNFFNTFIIVGGIFIVVSFVFGIVSETLRRNSDK